MTKPPHKSSSIDSDTQEPRSYVIRVYRSTLHRMVGQVEDVQSGLVRTFRSAGELWRAIGGSSNRQDGSDLDSPE